MALSTAWGWSNLANIVLSVALAFLFGYLLTIRSMYRKDSRGREAVKVAIATDTTSITSMEAIDNTFILLVPGAINATLSSFLFWISLAASLVIAFVLTVPVNRWFIARSGGHQHMNH
jgi:hypothetical protein